MAINKRNGSYQVRLEAGDGRILSKTFVRKDDAIRQELEWKTQKRHGNLSSVLVLQKTLDGFFEEWFRDVESEVTQVEKSGWRKGQMALYKRYISPLIGSAELRSIRPSHVKNVVNNAAQSGLAPQTRLHVYALMRKVFGDAIDTYEYLTRNPVSRKFRPIVPQIEAAFLNIEQSKKLLVHVDCKKYGLAIWIQLFLGLRVGELQALRWIDIDLDSRRVTIRRSFNRKMNCFTDYPKGKKQHSHAIPPELYERFKCEKKTAVSELVVTSPKGNVLPYLWYLRQLNTYLREVKLPKLGTHGLRHSTAELYLNNGAQRDDIRELFAHSSTKITERYMHGRESNLDKVTVGLKVF